MRIKWTGHETVHSPTYSSEVKISGTLPSLHHTSSWHCAQAQGRLCDFTPPHAMAKSDAKYPRAWAVTVRGKGRWKGQPGARSLVRYRFPSPPSIPRITVTVNEARIYLAESTNYVKEYCDIKYVCPSPSAEMKVVLLLPRSYRCRALQKAWCHTVSPLHYIQCLRMCKCSARQMSIKPNPAARHVTMRSSSWAIKVRIIHLQQYKKNRKNWPKWFNNTVPTNSSNSVKYISSWGFGGKARRKRTVWKTKA
jgi:hypothetical protein